MKQLEKRLMILLVLVTISALVISSVIGAPAGTGTITPTSSSRMTDPANGQLTAEAGNVTNFDVSSIRNTNYWAGFYGDVTGTITLETSGGATFYNWSDASPTGEIYASRDNSVTWGSIACASGANVAAEEGTLNILPTASDSMNATFYRVGNHSQFDVGTESFTEDECDYRTNAFDSSGAQIVNWDQILLYEGSHLVYSTIINQDTSGFDGSNYDFELLVATNTTIQTYYFYVEIV
ncbi:MAG: hypothetical protein ABIC91_02615 [Nanoarchaeota archaeon]|nr:hypothetical protein [Nanoarchaeota archaeon]MBU1029850.1 hypothetical protein [Nanoarchaeota archaeon]MBU1849424.1 hypothetical protein [Nanoarchaeota archaeon]